MRQFDVRVGGPHFFAVFFVAAFLGAAFFAAAFFAAAFLGAAFFAAVFFGAAFFAAAFLGAAFFAAAFLGAAFFATGDAAFFGDVEAAAAGADMSIGFGRAICMTTVPVFQSEERRRHAVEEGVGAL